METIECPVCTESFDRTKRIPLVLHCGHSICKKCTIELLEYKKSIVCPLDRKTDSRPISQISFSYTILELIDHVSTMSAKIKFLSMTPEARINALKVEAGEKLAKIDEDIEKINNRVNDVETMKTSLLIEIDDSFAKLNSALIDRKNVLKEEVEMLTEESLDKYHELLENIGELRKQVEEQMSGVNESSQNSIYSISVPQVPDIPDQNLKLKFTEDSDKLLSLFKHYGRIRNMTTSVPYNCDHFTNITY